MLTCGGGNGGSMLGYRSSQRRFFWVGSILGPGTPRQDKGDLMEPFARFCFLRAI